MPSCTRADGVALDPVAPAAATATQRTSRSAAAAANRGRPVAVGTIDIERRGPTAVNAVSSGSLRAVRPEAPEIALGVAGHVVTRAVVGVVQLAHDLGALGTRALVVRVDALADDDVDALAHCPELARGLQP